jgi:small subunit ribosomal protein S16
MAITLRLARYGTKKRPFYRIVAADTRARRDGRFLEQVGTYDPSAEPPAVALNRDRVKHWRDVGAVPSDTVREILNKFMNASDTAFRPTLKRKVAAAESQS